MSDSSLESKISQLVESEDFFDDFKKQISLIKDPEKKCKFYETLMGYKLSKLKTQDVVPEDRFRPITINYTVSGVDTTVDNGNADT